MEEIASHNESQFLDFSNNLSRDPTPKEYPLTQQRQQKVGKSKTTATPNSKKLSYEDSSFSNSKDKTGTEMPTVDFNSCIDESINDNNLQSIRHLMEYNQQGCDIESIGDNFASPMAPRSEDGEFSISRKSPKFGDHDEFSFQANKWELIKDRSDDYRDPEAWKDGGFPLND